jgi:hypothetical protein
MFISTGSTVAGFFTLKKVGNSQLNIWGKERDISRCFGEENIKRRRVKGRKCKRTKIGERKSENGK